MTEKGPYRTIWRRLIGRRHVVTSHDDWMNGPLFTVNLGTGEKRRQHRTHSRYREYTVPHDPAGDCNGTRCDVCGCCEHCLSDGCGCPMATVTTPFVLTCPGRGCGCTGGGE